MRRGKKKKGKVFQVEGIACAKALRQEDVAPSSQREQRSAGWCAAFKDDARGPRRGQTCDQ